MAGKIFVNYRRDDSASQALNVAQYLENTFGKARIFIDVDRLRAGQKFPAVLEDKLGQCAVMLTVIGPGWLGARDEKTGARRLDDPADWVRLEIERASARGVPVIPVLVGGAKLPDRSEVPASLQPLMDHQTATVSTNGFRHEMAGLARDVAELVDPPSRGRRAGAAGAVVAVLAGGYVAAHQMGAPVWWPGGDPAKLVTGGAANPDPKGQHGEASAKQNAEVGAAAARDKEARDAAAHKSEADAAAAETQARAKEAEQKRLAAATLEKQSKARRDAAMPAQDPVEAKALGLTLFAVDQGAAILSVKPGSLAASLDLKPGEIIVSADGSAIAGPDGVEALLKSARAAGRGAVLFSVKSPEGERPVLVGLQKPLEVAVLPDETTVIEALGLSISNERLLEGVRIDEVKPNSNAAIKKLSARDVVLEAGQQKIDTIAVLEDAVRQAVAAGRTAIVLKVKTNDGNVRFVPVGIVASRTADLSTGADAGSRKDPAPAPTSAPWVPLKIIDLAISRTIQVQTMRFRGIRLTVDAGSVKIAKVVLTLDGKVVHTEARLIDLRTHERSRPITWGDLRAFDQIEFTLAETGNAATVVKIEGQPP